MLGGLIFDPRWLTLFRRLAGSGLQRADNDRFLHDFAVSPHPRDQLVHSGFERMQILEGLLFHGPEIIAMPIDQALAHQAGVPCQHKTSVGRIPFGRQSDPAFDGILRFSLFWVLQPRPPTGLNFGILEAVC